MRRSWSTVGGVLSLYGIWMLLRLSLLLGFLFGVRDTGLRGVNFDFCDRFCWIGRNHRLQKRPLRKQI